MENERDRIPVISLFVERFDDFFDHGIYPSIAFGILLTWIWMGLTEGYPVFLDGRLDLIAIIVLFAAFVATLFALGFVDPCRKMIRKPALWVGASVVAAAVGLFLLAVDFHQLPLAPRLAGTLVRVSMVAFGAAAAVMVVPCGAGFACSRPMSAAIGFTFSVVVTFALFFCLNTSKPPVRGVLFCGLLPLAAAALVQGRGPIVERLDLVPSEKLPYASGFKSMCIAFCVFFFAIGAKCALEPREEFAAAADTSMVGILAVSLAFLWAIGLKPNPVGVFKALKNSYAGAVMVLAVCIAIAPLSLEPYAGIVYNADVVVMIMVLWLLTAFVAHFNEIPVERIIALAIGTAALGMAIGWVTGTWLYDSLGHDRSYPTIGIACAVVVFSTVGFSGKSFPRLTNRRTAAQKVEKVAAPYRPELFCAEMTTRYCLSARECEVLGLMVGGLGAEGIAEQLAVSYHTARTHIRNIYRKMDIHSQRDLLDAYELARTLYEEQDS